jgi:hypothetical protein
MARYVIPDNFIDGGRVFGGTFKTRNFIEGLVFGGISGLIAYKLPISSLQLRISMIIIFAAPGLLLGIFGINNDPLTAFIHNVHSWRKNRKIMLYNAAVQGRSDDIVDKMLSQKTAQDLLSEQLKAFREKNGAEEDTRSIEGVDFVFEEDPELTKYQETEQTSGHFGKKHAAQQEYFVDVSEFMDTE